MTGQVKEEIITRFAELGLYVIDGRLLFDSFLVEDEEYCSEPHTLRYVDVGGASREMHVPAGSYGFTFCQTPILVSASGASGTEGGLRVHRAHGKTEDIDFPWCPAEVSRAIFAKSGEITRVEVTFMR